MSESMLDDENGLLRLNTQYSVLRDKMLDMSDSDSLLGENVVHEAYMKDAQRLASSDPSAASSFGSPRLIAISRGFILRENISSVIPLLS